MKAMGNCDLGAHTTVEVAPVLFTPPEPEPTLEEYERLFGVDEDAYEQPTTTRKELWSYYLYYNGENLCSNTLSKT